MVEARELIQAVYNLIAPKLEGIPDTQKPNTISGAIKDDLSHAWLYQHGFLRTFLTEFGGNVNRLAENLTKQYLQPVSAEPPNYDLTMTDRVSVQLKRSRETADIEPAVIARAQMGDHAAFEEICLSYWNPIYKFVYRMMGNPEDAFDLTQETFMKAYQALPRTSHNLRVGAWIYRIATNACLDELRHRKLIRWQPWESFISVFHPSQISRDNPERDVLDGENQEETQAILDRLYPKYRACLILYHYQDLSYNEIAEALGATRATVKSLIFRAREEFRQVYARTDRRPALPAA